MTPILDVLAENDRMRNNLRVAVVYGENARYELVNSMVKCLVSELGGSVPVVMSPMGSPADLTATMPVYVLVLDGSVTDMELFEWMKLYDSKYSCLVVSAESWSMEPVRMFDELKRHLCYAVNRLKGMHDHDTES